MKHYSAPTILYLVPHLLLVLDIHAVCTGVVSTWVIGGTIVLIKPSLYYLMWLSGANKGTRLCLLT